MKLAVFDCDGTLLDSHHSIVNAMNDTFAHHSLAPVPAAEIRSIIGLPLEVGIARLLEEDPRDAHHEFAATYRRVFRGMRDAGEVSEPMFGGTREAIEILDEAGWLMGIATGKARRGVDAALGPLQLLKHFMTIQTADVAKGKPHPDMLDRAMAETGVDRRRTAMIGDTTFDMEMARNAGVAGIGVAWGYHPPAALHAAGAHVVIDDWRDLQTALDAVLGG
ncbi:MAG: HAD-IA family hydrolase [Rhodospirillales bacterium]